MIRLFTTIGEFAFWLLWPDTFAVVLVKRLFAACPHEERADAFKLIAACDNVRELEGVVLYLEAHWARNRQPDAFVADTIRAP